MVVIPSAGYGNIRSWHPAAENMIGSCHSQTENWGSRNKRSGELLAS